MSLALLLFQLPPAHAALAATIPAVTAAAAGKVIAKAQVADTIAAIVPSITDAEVVKGRVAATIPAISLLATGTDITIHAQVARSYDAITAALAGAVVDHGRVAAPVPPLALTTAIGVRDRASATLAMDVITPHIWAERNVGPPVEFIQTYAGLLRVGLPGRNRAVFKVPGGAMKKP